MPAKFAKKLSTSASKDLADSPEGVTPTPKEKQVSNTTPPKRKAQKGEAEGDSSKKKRAKKAKEGPYTCSWAAIVVLLVLILAIHRRAVACTGRLYKVGSQSTQNLPDSAQM